MKQRVWIGPANDQRSCSEAIQMGTQAVLEKTPRGETWAVKLNLTYPRYLPGVVNSPLFIEGMCAWASDVGLRIVFIEGDGGNGFYSAEDTLQGNGVTQLAQRYGMRTASVSQTPWQWRETTVLNRTVRLPYSPFFVRREYDRFVSAPLFKTHIFTVVSLGMKNLWGCIPDAYRMYYHHILDHGIVALTKELQPDLSIFDGLRALRGNGPLDGTPMPMHCIMVAGSIGAGEVAALAVMNIAQRRVVHLTIAAREGVLPGTEDLALLSSFEPFQGWDFPLTRTLINRAVMWLAKSPRLQKVVYHSPLSPLLYTMVNPFRRGSVQANLWLAHHSGQYTHIPFNRGEDLSAHKRHPMS